MARGEAFGKPNAMREKGAMQFRPHTASDHSAIAELRWLLKTIEEEGEPATGPGLRQEFTRGYTAQLEASDEAGDTVHWVAETGGALAGVLTIRLVRKELSPGKEPGHWGYLTNVAMREEFRDRGLGTQLLRHAIDWSRANALELLVVWPSERSYPFYRRAGFVGRDDPLTLDLT